MPNEVVMRELLGASDAITGSNLADIIKGYAGEDILKGNGGDDTFFFAPGYGHDTIQDFVAGPTEDKIDLTAFGSIHTLSDALSHATQAGADTVLDFGNGDTLTLQNVTKTSLTTEDFVLHTDPSGRQFQAPASVLGSFAPSAGGWASQDLYPRQVADVD